MSYLMIENDGVVDIAALTLLGLSSSRGDESKIGMFGTGAKHSILLCLREGLDVIIFASRKKITFKTEPGHVNGTPYGKVFCHDGRSKRELGVALEFGATDWTSIDMALREFISNSIDAGGHHVEMVDEPVGKEGRTRVFVEVNSVVRKYYQQLDEKFLHFGTWFDGTRRKKSDGYAKIYKKGVFVREITWSNALFDYNFGDSLKLDECRNLDNYGVVNEISTLMTDVDLVKDVLLLVNDNPYSMEANDLSSWRLEESARQCAGIWREAFAKAFGPNAVLCTTGMVEHVSRKGWTPIVLPLIWFSACCQANVPQVQNVLHDFNEDGTQDVQVPPEYRETFERVWTWLELVGMTNGKPRPILKCFKKIMDGGSETQGRYKNGTVYINVDYNIPQVYLEECAHYVTGANDNSRDFQDYAFRLAATIAKEAGL